MSLGSDVSRPSRSHLRNSGETYSQFSDVKSGGADRVSNIEGAEDIVM